jgi:hypothetical protein
MLGTVALGQKSITAHHRQAAAPAASPFLARKEGMAAIEGEVAEAGRIGPVHAGDTGQRIINSQWRLLGQEKGREPEPAAKADILVDSVSRLVPSTMAASAGILASGAPSMGIIHQTRSTR